MELNLKKNIRIIGIPLDLGQTHRGVNMGPSAVRYAGLSNRLRELGYTVNDIGNIQFPIRETLFEKGKEFILPALIKANESIYVEAKKAIQDNTLPIFLGGDHSIAIGTIGGITDNTQKGIIWIDAHGDFNTPETSKSGNIHGMPLATLLGKGYNELVNLGRKGAKIIPKNVVLIGLRDIDPKEKEIIKSSGVTFFTMRDIDEQGISNVMYQTLKKLSHIEEIHVSLDMDSIDPMICPGVGTPVKGGLTYREAHLAMEIIADSKKLSSVDIVEINPMLDIHNKTAEIAVELMVSLMGKSII
jgi:arginase